MSSLKKIKEYFLLFLSALFIFSCSIDPDIRIEGSNNNSIPDLTTKVTASLISGFITDDNGNPVQGATVVAGGINTLSDYYGYFEIKNAAVLQQAATVTIQKQGYFKTVRTFFASTGKGAFFRVKLITKITAGSISGTTGGTINLSTGLSIVIPPNAVFFPNSSIPYTGTINVFAKLIKADDPDLNSLMPGDLRGIDSVNSVKLLTTYGMVAIELTEPNAVVVLQLAPGKKATLTIPIPATLQSEAPSSIPLWYFNESKGLWQEEGSAVKTGNFYTGQVSHFSFWNCDYPAPLVRFDCTVMGTNGQPVSNAFIRILLLSNTRIRGYGFTDANGYLTGFIPANAQLRLEINPTTSCASQYIQDFTTGNNNISLGTFTFSVPMGLASISGKITDCSNNPLSNGYLVLIRNGQYYRINTNAGGNYSFNILLCGNNNNVTLVAVDPAANQQSAPFNYTLNAGNNSIPNLQACGFATNIFVHTVRNGVPYNWNNPPDTIRTYNPGNNNIGIMHFMDVTMTIPTQIIFSGTGIGVGTDQTLLSFQNMTINNPPVLVHITEYGQVGQFISGNFSGSFTASNNTVYNTTCSFRMRRTY